MSLKRDDLIKPAYVKACYRRGRKMVVAGLRKR